MLVKFIYINNSLDILKQIGLVSHPEKSYSGTYQIFLAQNGKLLYETFPVYPGHTLTNDFLCKMANLCMKCFRFIRVRRK